MNLFSSFDPSTYKILSLNWLSILSPLIFMPLYWWLIPSRWNITFSSFAKNINKENSSIISTSNIEGTTLMFISLMFMILSFNFLGLSPYMFTPSSHPSITMFLALSFWLTLIIFGWFNSTKTMLAHMMPLGTPTMLMNFMVIIETSSNLIRPITLSVRLSANMIAGHLLLSLIGSTLNQTKTSLSMLVYLAQTLLMILEMAVAIIQSYVFMTLLTLYLTEIH